MNILAAITLAALAALLLRPVKAGVESRATNVAAALIAGTVAAVLIAGVITHPREAIQSVMWILEG